MKWFLWWQWQAIKKSKPRTAQLLQRTADRPQNGVGDLAVDTATILVSAPFHLLGCVVFGINWLDKIFLLLYFWVTALFSNTPSHQGAAIRFWLSDTRSDRRAVYARSTNLYPRFVIHSWEYRLFKSDLYNMFHLPINWLMTRKVISEIVYKYHHELGPDMWTVLITGNLA